MSVCLSPLVQVAAVVHVALAAVIVSAVFGLGGTAAGQSTAPEWTAEFVQQALADAREG